MPGFQVLECPVVVRHINEHRWIVNLCSLMFFANIGVEA